MDAMYIYIYMYMYLGSTKVLPEHQSSSYMKTSVLTREAVNKNNHDGRESLSLKGTLPGSGVPGVGTGVHRYDNGKAPSSSGMN
jgi:hypothetical protein